MIATAHLQTTHPIPDEITRVFEDLILHRALNLALDDRDTVADAVSDKEINDLQENEITAPKLAVYRKVEQRQLSEIASKFQQRAFLANQPSLVLGMTLRFDGGELDFGHEFSSIHPSHS